MQNLDSVLALLNNHQGYGTETVPLQASLHRTVAEKVYSDIDMPPFNKSAMDGYACRQEDIENALQLIEIIPAGQFPTKTITKNLCAKIMTGAPVPNGADMVFMIEDSIATENNVSCTNPHSKKNICYKGEDITSGAVVIEAETYIKPHHIAIMASVGYTNVLVRKLPAVGVISTGTELVEPHIKPAASHIRNSNGSQVVSQLLTLGIVAKYYGIANDAEGMLEQLFNTAALENDIVILTGGVSAGDYDLVPEIVAKSGYTILVDRIAIQPGKPAMIATKGNSMCFGLSGNPVSSFLQFNLLVKHFILQSGNSCAQNKKLRLPLMEDFDRKKGQRTLFVPIVLENGMVKQVQYNGSAHIAAFANADGFMEISQGITHIDKGDWVDVRQL